MNAPNINVVNRGYLKKFTPVVNWSEMLDDINNGVIVFKLKYKNRTISTVETIKKVLDDNTIETVDENGRTNYLQSYDTLKSIYDSMVTDKVVNNGWWNKTRLYKK